MEETKVLLHTCCAPCSSAIIECLMQNGITPTIYYCNPNIYPQQEYEIRKQECTRYAESLGLELQYDEEHGYYYAFPLTFAETGNLGPYS